MNQQHFISLRQIIGTIRANRSLIGACILISMSISMIYVIFARPEYRAAVTVRVITSKTQDMPTEMSHQSMFEMDEMLFKVRSLPEYFQSPGLGETVLNKTLSSGFGFIPFQGITGLRGFLNRLGLAQGISLDEALKKRSRQEVVNDIIGRLSISSDPANYSVNIKTSSSNPVFAAFLANTGAKALVLENDKRNTQRIVEVKKFYGSQEASLREKLTSLENELTAYQSENKMINVDDADKLVHERINSNDQEITSTRILLKSNGILIEETAKMMKTVRDNLSNPLFGGGNFYLAQMQQRMSMLQYQQAYNYKIPGQHDKEAIQKELDQLAKAYKSALAARGPINEMAAMSPLEYYQYLEQTLASLQRDKKKLLANLDVLEKVATDSKQKIPKLAENLQRLTEIKRNIQITSDLYLALRKSLQELEIQEAGHVSDLEIVAEASVPTRPYSLPIALIIIFAIALGLFFGLMIVLIRESWIPAIRDRHDLFAVNVLPIGEVPQVANLTKKEIIVNKMPVSFEADSLRSIRLKLISFLRSQNTSVGTIVQITSPCMGSGKTFMSVNLATVLAKSQIKTLLIDLDLRRPSVHQYFSKSRSEKGIGDLHSFSAENHNSIIFQAEPFLDVVLTGKKTDNPAEFLDSTKVREFIAEQRKQYDVIIIDTPPTLGILDPVIVAGMVDHVILVLEHRKTLREDLRLAHDVLKDVNNKQMLGILNYIQQDFTYMATYSGTQLYFKDHHKSG